MASRVNSTDAVLQAFHYDNSTCTQSRSDTSSRGKGTRISKPHALRSKGLTTAAQGCQSSTTHKQKWQDAPAGCSAHRPTNSRYTSWLSAACTQEERRNCVASELDGRSYSMPQAKQCDGVASELDGRSFPVALQSQVTCRISSIDMYTYMYI